MDEEHLVMGVVSGVSLSTARNANAGHGGRRVPIRACAQGATRCQLIGYWTCQGAVVVAPVVALMMRTSPGPALTGMQTIGPQVFPPESSVGTPRIEVPSGDHSMLTQPFGRIGPTSSFAPVWTSTTAIALKSWPLSFACRTQYRNATRVPSVDHNMPFSS